MPFQAYMPGGLPGFSSPEEVTLARMQEEERLKEQQLLAPPVEEVPTAPIATEEPGFLGRAAANFGNTLVGSRYMQSPVSEAPQALPKPALKSTATPLGSTPLGRLAYYTRPSEMLGDIASSIGSFSDILTPTEALEKPWLTAPNKAAGTRAAALAAERLNNVKSTPPAKAAQAVADTATASSRPTMLVTIDGKTYDYSDPSVRAPKLTGDRVALRERGPGAFVPTYSPDTGSITATQRVPEVATLPEKFRPGVSTMESPARTQLLEYATRQRLGEARRGAERAEMSPREAAMLDPRVIAEQIKLQKPERLQFAMQKIAEVTGARTAEEWAKKAIARAIQADPKLAIAYKHAQAGDTRAQADYMKATAPLMESAMKEYNGMIISVLGSDPYRQDPMAGLSLQPTPPGS